MLNLSGISKTFNSGTVNEKILFRNFDLKIEKGQFVSVVGSNGSGKTTLLNIITGDVSVDSGKIYIADEDFTNIKNFRRAQKIARVFQDPSKGTCPSMTIFENMSLADNKLKSFNLTKGLNTKRKEFYQTQLEQLGMGLENRMDTYTANLSGGQRQALALIMATMVTPDLLLLDEHTASLDPKSSDIVMELTQKIIESKRLTTLMVTHNLRHATNFGNRLIMLHEGDIVLDTKDDEKQSRTIDDLLTVFNEISIECGN